MDTEICATLFSFNIRKERKYVIENETEIMIEFQKDKENKKH